MSKEALSALMDGELAPEELDSLLDALQQDGDLLGKWQAWRLASDTLRGEPSLSSGFMADFSQRLAVEPVVLAPHRMVRKLPLRACSWMSCGVAALLAFVGIVLWQGNVGGSVAVPASASLSSPASQSSLRDYLAAHWESDSNLFAEREVIYAKIQPSDTF